MREAPIPIHRTENREREAIPLFPCLFHADSRSMPAQKPSGFNKPGKYGRVKRSLFPYSFLFDCAARMGYVGLPPKPA